MANHPAEPKFDVFLSYNRKDQAAVIALAERLKAYGLKVWLDVWELRPGHPWQEALERIIETTRAAAVLVGTDGLGPWQDREMRGCLSEFVEHDLPVIPVLLPGCPTVPKLPFFLKQFTWVDLRDGQEEEGFRRLVWGITGDKPSFVSPPPPPVVPPNKTDATSSVSSPSTRPEAAKESEGKWDSIKKFKPMFPKLGGMVMAVAVAGLILLVDIKQKLSDFIKPQPATPPIAAIAQPSSPPASNPPIAPAKSLPPSTMADPEMVSLPGGEFWMGSEKNDPEAYDDEKPRPKSR